jgi:hypothetical protein
MFEEYTIVVLGYRLCDPVIKWVAERLKNDWALNPDWYALVPNVKEVDIRKEMEERKLHLLNYSLPSVKDDSKSHELGLTEWFKCLGRELNIDNLSPKVIFDIITPNAEWVTLSEQYLKDLPAVDPEHLQGYYNGEPPTWSIVKDGYTAKRRATEDVLKKLIGGGFKAVLVKGAGGEGKSTILMQVALELFRGDYTLFFANEPDGDPFEIIKANKGRIAIVINKADQIKNLRGLLRFCANRSQDLKLILAARSNEWLYSYGKTGSLGDAARYLQTVNIDRLAPSEAEEIANLLIRSHVVTDVDAITLMNRLLNDSNGFLLAAMLTTTHGQPLSEILADVVKRV